MSPAHLKLMPPAHKKPPAEDRAESMERLVDGLRAGRPWAERAFLDRYTRRVQTVLARIMGSREALDDTTQEVFIRALERLEALRDPDALGVWLTQFAVNVAREQLRRRKYRQ